MTVHEQARQGTECRRSIAVERDIFAARRGIARRTAARRAISPREHRLTRTKSQRRYVIKWVTQVNPRPGCRRPPPPRSKTARDEQRVSEASARHCRRFVSFRPGRRSGGAWEHFLPHFLGLTIPPPDDGYTKPCRSVRRTAIDRSELWSWQLPLAFPPAGSADPFLCRPESTCEGRRMLLVWVTQSR
jgi:hypothetical protein